MKETFSNKIRNDLKDSQIGWKVIIAFIPIAFFTYLFHEFGHWTFGEPLGNDMILSLNNSAPKNRQFIGDSDALWSAIGGPVFTILHGLIFLFLTWLTKSIYAYSITFLLYFQDSSQSFLEELISKMKQGLLRCWIGISILLQR